MSTLFGGTDPAHPSRPLRSPEDLLSVFRAGEKPRERFGIGIEYERLPVERETGLAVPYARPEGKEGRRGRARATVEGFLESMAASHGWEPARENGRIIALRRGETMLTIEPGAQVELSGRVHTALDTAREELLGFVREADEAAAMMGFAFLPLGRHPFSHETEIAWVPKARYRIMAPYLARRGHLAHTMMKATAGCQINLDYAGEDDAMEKLRVSMGLTSLVTAMCANSPLSRGQRNGFASQRSHVWLHTDPDRCGLLEFALREDSAYADYMEYALDVPMLFVVRDGRWVAMTDRTFRSYMNGHSSGLTPTMGDWELHLTTLFPECRIKSWLEVRGSDSAQPDLILAQAALWKGILYDGAARRRAWELVRRHEFPQRLAFHHDVSRYGLDARLGGTPAIDLAAELLAAAAGGLPPGEAGHLDPLCRIVEQDRSCPAVDIVRRWHGEWNHDPRRLVAALAPDPTHRSV